MPPFEHGSRATRADDRAPFSAPLRGSRIWSETSTRRVAPQERRANYTVLRNVLAIFRSRSIRRSARSTRRCAKGDDAATLGDMLPANDVDPTEKLEREQAEAAVHELPKRLRTVIRARFWAERTLKEIGEAELGGISRERVRQLESDALDALERASGTPNGPTAKQQRAAARRRAA